MLKRAPERCAGYAPAMAKPSLKEKAIELRAARRMSLNEIREVVPVSKSTLSLWLRPHPLNDAELTTRQIENGKKNGHKSKRSRTASQRPIPIASISPSSFSNPSSPNRLRAAALGAAIDWFMSRGYMASLPLDQASYDLIVESDAGLMRVQVKSTTKRDRYGRWYVNAYRNGYDPGVAMNSSGRRKRRAYRAHEIDCFFILNGARDVYIIPLAATGGKAHLTLDRAYAAFKM